MFLLQDTFLHSIKLYYCIALDNADKQMRLFVIFEGELDHLLFTSFHIHESVNINAYTMFMSLLPILIS